MLCGAHQPCKTCQGILAFLQKVVASANACTSASGVYTAPLVNAVQAVVSCCCTAHLKLWICWVVVSGVVVGARNSENSCFNVVCKRVCLLAENVLSLAAGDGKRGKTRGPPSVDPRTVRTTSFYLHVVHVFERHQLLSLGIMQGLQFPGRPYLFFGDRPI